MSRRNNDAITIHSILSWIEDNLESPLSLEKVSERSGYSKWHLQRMFKKEDRSLPRPVHPQPQADRDRAEAQAEQRADPLSGGALRF